MTTATAVDYDQLAEVRVGDQIVVRFTPRAYDDLVYVLAMHRTNRLSLTPGQVTNLEDARGGQPAGWHTPAGRSYIFVAGPAWDRDFFQGRMTPRVLESLEVTPHN